MCKDIDADGNSQIEFNEFVAMMGDKVSGKDGVDEMKSLQAFRYPAGVRLELRSSLLSPRRLAR